MLHGAATAEGPVDLDLFASAVAGLDVDVLGLQEVDRAQPRSGGADLTTVAAEAMGAVEHRFAPTLHGVPGAWGPDGAADSPAYGIALLSRLPVVDWRVVPLPRLPTAYRWWSGTRAASSSSATSRASPSPPASSGRTGR